MRRVAIGFAFALGGWVWIGACSTFTQAPNDPSSAGDAAGTPETSVSDALVLDSSTNPDTTDAGGALLRNPGFENAGTACAPGWEVLYGTASPTTDAHGGQSACRVCTASNTTAALLS